MFLSPEEKVFKDQRKKDKNHIMNISPRQFEELIEQMFQGMGYLTELTPESNDGGKDIIVVKDDKTYYVECKQYKDGAIGREIIQKLVGSGIIDGGVDGYFVTTTGYFNTNAIECSRKMDKLFLLDLDDILDYFDKINNNSISLKTSETAIKSRDWLCLKCGNPLSYYDRTFYCTNQDCVEYRIEKEFGLPIKNGIYHICPKCTDKLLKSYGNKIIYFRCLRCNYSIAQKN